MILIEEMKIYILNTTRFYHEDFEEYPGAWFGYLIEHLYGQTGTAYEDYEYYLPKKRFQEETLVKYYDLIKPTRCLIEENQRYLKIEQEDGTVYAAYFTINSIVGELDFPSSEIFYYQQQQFTFPIDTSMNVEIVTNRKALSTVRNKKKELKDLDNHAWQNDSEREYGIEEYLNVLLAIIQVESGGTLEDVMQSSESLGLPPNSLSTEESIKQGCKYFSELLAAAEAKGCDLNSVLQSYNYGGGFLDYVAGRGKKYTFELAESFARDKSGGKKVTYTNPVAVEKNGGWRYSYGNMFYVLLVSQYLTVAQFDDETVQAIMEEALKYEGWTYVYGGDSPSTSFDCSGLVQWCYGKAGITLPRTAQEQYNVTQHIPLSEAKAGDLVFFHSTYNAGTYITHVGLYVGNNRMYHAGNPIGYADLTGSYWQQHLAGAGRIKQ